MNPSKLNKPPLSPEHVTPNMHPMSYPDLIAAELKRIPRETLPNGASNTIWTREIKKAIGALGKKKWDFSICAGGDNGFESEWLYDLVWYRETDKSQLIETAMILESEWAGDYFSIKYDFEKLLVGKAQCKVMIFQATGSVKEDYFSRLIEAIGIFKNPSPNETYLFACFDESSWDFDIRMHTT